MPVVVVVVVVGVEKKGPGIRQLLLEILKKNKISGLELVFDRNGDQQLRSRARLWWWWASQCDPMPANKISP